MERCRGMIYWVVLIYRSGVKGGWQECGEAGVEVGLPREACAGWRSVSSICHGMGAANDSRAGPRVVT